MKVAYLNPEVAYLNPEVIYLNPEVVCLNPEVVYFEIVFHLPWVGYYRSRLRIILLPLDLTQITLRSELLSQIRGSVVVLRDQIHRELGNLINLVRVIKLG